MNEDQTDLLLTALEQPKLLTKIQIQARVFLNRSHKKLYGYISPEELANVGWVKAAESIDAYDAGKGAALDTYLCNKARDGMRDYLKAQVRYDANVSVYDHGHDVMYETDPETGITEAIAYYTITQVENQIDFHRLLEPLEALANAQEMIWLWCKGVTLREIGEEFDIDFTWASRKIDGYLSRIRAAVWQDVLTLTCA